MTIDSFEHEAFDIYIGIRVDIYIGIRIEARDDVLMSLSNLLLFVPGQIEPPRRILIVPQMCHNLVGTQGLDQDARIRRRNESTRHCILHPVNQARPIAIHIEDDDGHAMYAQLIPRRNLHQLLKCAVAATQRNETTTRSTIDDLLGHGLLARVHVFDDGCATVYRGVNGVARRIVGVIVLFEFDEGCGDDAVDAVGPAERDEGSGYFAHEADSAAAVDELGVGGVEGVGKGAGGGHVHW